MPILAFLKDFFLHNLPFFLPWLQYNSTLATQYNLKVELNPFQQDKFLPKIRMAAAAEVEAVTNVKSGAQEQPPSTWWEKNSLNVVGT